MSTAHPPRTAAQFLLLLIILSLGYLLVRTDQADPALAAQIPPKSHAFRPPFGTRVMPVEKVQAPAQGGVFVLSSGTEVSIPENAFVDAFGQVVTDSVNLTVREYLNPLETWLDGIPMAMGEDHVLRSAGMMEIRGTTQDGRQVELAPDKTLQLDWYSVDDDKGYVTWALDTATGIWTETGTANTVDTRDLNVELAKSEAALPPRLEPVAPNRFAFDIGDMTGKQPELARYKGIQFVPVERKRCGHDATRIEVEPITDGLGGSFAVKFIVDTVLSARFKASSFDTTTYRSSWRVDTTTICRCNMGLPPGANDRLTARIQKLLNGDTDRKRQKGLDKAIELWTEYNAKVERQFLAGLLRPNNLPKQLDRPGRIPRRSMQLNQLGWVNCDIEIPYPTTVDLVAEFIDSAGSTLVVENVTVLELETRTLFPCKNNRIRLDPRQHNAVFGYVNGQVAYLDDGTISQLRSSIHPEPVMIQTATLSDLQDSSSTIAKLILGG